MADNAAKNRMWQLSFTKISILHKKLLSKLFSFLCFVFSFPLFLLFVCVLVAVRAPLHRHGVDEAAVGAVCQQHGTPLHRLGGGRQGRHERHEPVGRRQADAQLSRDSIQTGQFSLSVSQIFLSIIF